MIMVPVASRRSDSRESRSRSRHRQPPPWHSDAGRHADRGFDRAGQGGSSSQPALLDRVSVDPNAMAEAINRKLHSIAESNQMTDRQLDQQGRKVQDVLDHLGGQDKKMLKIDGDIAWLAASYSAIAPVGRCFDAVCTRSNS